MSLRTIIQQCLLNRTGQLSTPDAQSNLVEGSVLLFKITSDSSGKH